MRKYCMEFGYLILRKNSKFVATRCQIMKAKNAPNASLQTPLGGAYSAPQTLLLDLREPTSKEREGKGWERDWERRVGNGRGGEQRGRKGGQGKVGRERAPPSSDPFRCLCPHLFCPAAETVAN